MSSAPRRPVVIAALALLIAVNLPRYVDRVSASDYVRAAQMVALVWSGFFLSARYWVKRDAVFSRSLLTAAAAICLPTLMYHLYGASGNTAHLGNLFLLLGIASYSYGALILGPREKGIGR